MKSFFYLSVMALLFVQCSNTAKTKSEEGTAAVKTYEDIDVAKMQAVAANLTSNQVIIDVRTPEEINDGYIKGTININFHLADFEEKINALDRDKEYYLYCRSGGRSAKAAKLMNKLGFEKVYNLDGGYQAWSKQ